MSWIFRKGNALKKDSNDNEDFLSVYPPAVRLYYQKEMNIRLRVSVFYSLILMLCVLPVWYKLATVYRAPFATFSNDTNVPLTVKIVLAGTNESEIDILLKLIERMESSLKEIQVEDPVFVNWLVENGGIRSYDDILGDRVSSDEVVARVAIVNVDEWPHFSATNVFLSRGSWSFLQWTGDLEKAAARLHELVADVLIDIPHLNIILKRDKRERLLSWQIAAMPLSHQKRLVWDSAPLSMNYVVQVVYLHNNAPMAENQGQSVEKLLKKFSSKLDGITTLKVSSEHLWDFDIPSYLVKDVQERWTLNQHFLDLLIKEVDFQLQTVESYDPVLRFVLIDYEEPIVMLDQMEEDSRGVAVASWGAVTPLNDHSAALVAGALRVLLGLDAELTTGFTRDPVPLAEWELTRLRLRSYIDNTIKVISSVRSLEVLTGKIAEIVIEDEVAEKVTRAYNMINSTISSSSPDLNVVRNARILADEAVHHSSLLAMLYFPQDEKAAVYFPVIIPYVFPIVASLIGLLFRTIFKTK